MPFRALRGFNVPFVCQVPATLDGGRNALPGIEGIQPKKILRRLGVRRPRVGRNALPGIEGIQPVKVASGRCKGRVDVVMPFRALRGFNARSSTARWVGLGVTS